MLKIKKFAFLSFLFLPFFLFTNPEGGSVKSGSATILSQNQTLTVNQSSEKAIIHWRDFSIKEGEAAEFKLPSSSASTLNRVVGEHLSEIYGSLKSNGILYLVNPHGILIGPSGKIDVNSFLASTYDLSDSDYLNGENLNFAETLSADDALSSAASQIILQKGEIFSSHGDIILIAREIENEGSLKAPEGKVSLNAGYELYLVPLEQMKSVIRLKKEGQVKADGVIKAVEVEIKASGGSAYALAVEAGGLIDAVGVETRDGKIVLSSEKTIDVTGKLFAGNENGTGGKVHLLGDTVKLENGSLIDVSGKQDGGEVLVGGDYQGKNPEIKNASYVLVDQEAFIQANSLENGHGGKVIFWSEKGTDWRGDVSIEGGKESGDGGLLEVSSHGFLRFPGQIRASALHGKTGTLLLDPYDVTISGAATANGAFGVGDPSTFTPSGTPCTLLNTDLQTALGAASVIVVTTGGGGEQGNITVSSAVTWDNANSLTLYATNKVVVSANITNTNSGSIIITADGGTSGATYKGVDNSATISCVDGNISITGFGGDTGNDNWGFRNIGIITTTGAGSIDINGTGGDAAGYNYGAYNSGNIIASGTGDVTIIGFGGDGTGDGYNNGVYNNVAGEISTVSGTLNIEGTGGAAAAGGANSGLQNQAAAVIKTGAGGAISITAIGGASATANNYGILNLSGAKIYATDSGTVTVNGTGGAGTNDNYGIRNQDASTEIKTETGIITIIGTGGGTGNSNHGVSHTNSALIFSTSGAISVTGTGSTTGDDTNMGIYLNGPGAGSESKIYSAGAVSLNGTGGTKSDIVNGSNYGTALFAYTKVYSTGSTVTILGQGGGKDASVGSDVNNGVIIYGFSYVYAANGNVTITGTAGGRSNWNEGVMIKEGAEIYTTGSGNIAITGTGYCNDGGGGGDYSNNRGVVLRPDPNGNTIYSSGTGSITITGYGGGNGGSSGSGGIHDNEGIVVDSVDVIKTVSGTITLNGTPGGGSYGIKTVAGSEIGQAGGTPTTGAVTLTTDSASYAGTIYTTGILTLQPTTTSLAINIGTASDYITPANVLAYTTGHSHTYIGRANGTGLITLGGTADVVVDDNNTTFRGGNITVDNDALTSASNITMTLEVKQKITINDDGTISNTYAGADPINGIVLTAAGITSGNYIGIENNGTITSAKCHIVLNGTGGNGATNSNYGVYNTKVIESTNSANITIRGYNNGTGSHNIGVFNVGANARIRVTDGADTSTGTINIYGTGGLLTSTFENYGVANSTSGEIFTETGNINISGIGRGYKWNNSGILNESSAKIYVTSSGNMTLTGYGGKTTENGWQTHGIANGATIYATNGTLTLLGVGGGNWDSHGILNGGGKIYSSGTGSVSVTGIAGATTVATMDTYGNHGVYNNTGGEIYTGNGHLSVIGRGCKGSYSHNHCGIYNWATAGTNSKIYSSGSGNVTLKGYGSIKGSNNNYGIYQDGGDGSHLAKIYATSGTLTLIGVGGGTGIGSCGIYNDDYGDITGVKIYLLGYGSNKGSGDARYGIYQAAHGEITASGALTLRGIGGGDSAGVSDSGSSTGVPKTIISISVAP